MVVIEAKDRCGTHENIGQQDQVGMKYLKKADDATTTTYVG
jgi:hypothetical protein